MTSKAESYTLVKAARVFRRGCLVVPLAGIGLLFARLTLAQENHPHYTIVDRGPSLVRTLTETPGLNNHGDMAIWHSENASLMPGVLFHGTETIPIEGDKDFPLVYPSDINDRLTVVGTLQAAQDLRFTHAFKWSDKHMEILESVGGPYSSASAVNAAGDVVGAHRSATARSMQCCGTRNSRAISDSLAGAITALPTTSTIRAIS